MKRILTDLRLLKARIVAGFKEDPALFFIGVMGSAISAVMCWLAISLQHLNDMAGCR